MLLNNISVSTFIIGFSYQIHLIHEVKDESYAWKPIETMINYMCGNILPSILLPKAEIVLTYVTILELEKESWLSLEICENNFK